MRVMNIYRRFDLNHNTRREATIHEEYLPEIYLRDTDTTSLLRLLELIDIDRITIAYGESYGTTGCFHLSEVEMFKQKIIEHCESRNRAIPTIELYHA